MSFNDRDYTRSAIIKQLSLIELHGKDGSAVEAGCACIESKHLYMVEGLAEEGIGFSESKKEKEFYTKLSSLARNLRRNIESDQFVIPHVHASNPGAHRKHVGIGFTRCERDNPRVREELSRCVETKTLEECRASIKCPG